MRPVSYTHLDVYKRQGNCRMKQALIRDKRYPNLYLLPSAQTRDKTSVNPEQMIKLVDDLREEFDYILLDCPAGIEQEMCIRDSPSCGPVRQPASRGRAFVACGQAL